MHRYLRSELAAAAERNDDEVMLSPRLIVHMMANSHQILYDDHARYTYAGDMQAD